MYGEILSDEVHLRIQSRDHPKVAEVVTLRVQETTGREARRRKPDQGPLDVMDQGHQ